MATLGQTPEGLVARDDLPRPEPIPLAVWSRQGLAPPVSQQVSNALRRLLATPAVADGDLPAGGPGTDRVRSGTPFRNLRVADTASV
jgi:hypothetical protein